MEELVELSNFDVRVHDACVLIHWLKAVLTLVELPIEGLAFLRGVVLIFGIKLKTVLARKSLMMVLNRAFDGSF